MLAYMHEGLDSLQFLLILCPARVSISQTGSHTGNVARGRSSLFWQRWLSVRHASPPLHEKARRLREYDVDVDDLDLDDDEFNGARHVRKPGRRRK